MRQGLLANLCGFLWLAQCGLVLAQSSLPPLEDAHKPGGPTGEHGRCAQAYHAALKSIHAEEFEALDRMIKSMTRRDKTLPGRLLFRIPIFKREATAEGAARLAVQMAKRGGSDPYLSSPNASWIVRRITQDAKVYTGQEWNGAICTGAPFMLEFFRRHLKRISVRTRKTDDYLAAAKSEVMDMRSAFSTAAAAAGRDMMTSDIPLSVVNVPRLVSDIHDTALSPPRLSITAEVAGGVPRDVLETVGELKRSGDGPNGSPLPAVTGKERTDDAPAFRPAIFALQRRRDLVIGRRPRIETPALRAAAARYLSALERFVYVEMSRTKQIQTFDAIDRTLTRIEAAHREQCTC